jgi:hypothetical protein
LAVLHINQFHFQRGNPMTKTLLLVTTALGLTVALSGPAFAGHAVPAQPGKSNAHLTLGQHGVAVPGHRRAKYKLAYYYSRGFETSSSVGVAAFSNPSTGVYCITPSGSLGTNFPNVTVEWGASYGSTLSAFYEFGGFDCGGNVEVLTYDDSGNRNPNVAFDITIL